MEKAGCSELCRFGGQVGVQLSEAGSFWRPREQRMRKKELGFIFFVRRLSQGDWCLLTSWTGHTGRCCKLRAALVEAVQRRGHWGLWFCSMGLHRIHFTKLLLGCSCCTAHCRFVFVLMVFLDKRKTNKKEGFPTTPDQVHSSELRGLAFPKPGEQAVGDAPL